MSKINIQDCLMRIRSKDPLIFEEAFVEIEEVVSDYKNEILEALGSETDSHNKGKLIELLGLCEDSSLLPLLNKELEKKDRDTISWILSAIESLNLDEGNKIVQNFKKDNPEWD